MTTEHIGTRLPNQLNAYVAENEQIRLTRDHILVETIDWNPSKILAVAWHGEPLRGRVLAVGPGCHPWKYNGRKGHRTKRWEGKHFIPTTTKVGDIIQLGGLEIRGYLHKSFMWGSKRVFIMQEADIAFVEQAA